MGEEAGQKAEKSSYHHGDLPAALLKASAEAISERGVAALSLREIARRAGVSHSAPAHHFGDKLGLLTALATEGFERFADALTRARDAAGDSPMRQLSATGHAYVLFALSHPAHFEVMFQPDLHRADDPALLRAQRAARAVLQGVIGARKAEKQRSDPNTEAGVIRAWALAHGLACLALAGPIPNGEGGSWELQALLDTVLGKVD